MNYARFFANYARNPGSEYDPSRSPDPSHRRRVLAGKVLLSLRLFAAARHGLSDTCLPEIPVGTRRKQTSNKGAEQGFPVPPHPAGRFPDFPALKRGHTWLFSGAYPAAIRQTGAEMSESENKVAAFCENLAAGAGKWEGWDPCYRRRVMDGTGRNGCLSSHDIPGSQEKGLFFLPMGVRELCSQKVNNH